MLMTNWDFKEALKKVDEKINSNNLRATAPPKKTDHQRNRSNLNRLWAESKIIEQVTPENVSANMVSEYLHFSRGISLDIINSTIGLRQHGDLPYYDNKVMTGKHHAMMLRVSNFDGEESTERSSTLHTTYLQNGKKAFLPSAKKMMPRTEVPLVGGLIKLCNFSPINGTLGITEGIENALSIRQGMGIPVWSCMNADNMIAVNLPKGVKKLMIFADRDASFTGQATAYTLARKAVRAGLEAEVYMPKAGDGDWNDLLLVKKLSKDYIINSQV
jgi:putative DNA primase/helicase